MQVTFSIGNSVIRVDTVDYFNFFYLVVVSIHLLTQALTVFQMFKGFVLV